MMSAEERSLRNGGRFPDKARRVTQAEKPMRDEFIVCFARGYPGPFECYPPTLDYARDFQRRHGGIIKHRIVSEWEEVK